MEILRQVMDGAKVAMCNMFGELWVIADPALSDDDVLAAIALLATAV